MYTAFNQQNNWNNPICRDGCQVAPVIDGKVMVDHIGNLKNTMHRVPTLSGWTSDDGADFISADISLSGMTMSNTQYKTWWKRFRGRNTENERKANFHQRDYSPIGSATK